MPLTPEGRATVDQFAKQAAAYCVLLDEADRYSPGEFLRLVQQRLLEVVRAALDLPDISPGTEQNRVDLASKEAARIAQARLPPGLAEHAFYSHIFDPFEAPSEPPVGSDLRHDLVEIYEDLRSSLGRWKSGSEPEQADAVWDWRQGFIHHWGRHATEAIKTIHWLLFDQFIEFDDPKQR